ncbi:7488_t:CDS:2, partial [Dentiscutata erythropus]
MKKDEVLNRDGEKEKEKLQESLKIIEEIRKDNEKRETKSSKNEYDILLKSAIKEFKRGNYSSSICSLTSIISANHKNNQEQLLAVDAKFCNSNFKENARDKLIMCYSQGIGVKKDKSKADKLYN